jgi:predicted nuclease of restriction endonuclease-like RecB superfamily
MAFRRQDIRKTTRRPKDGGMRRLYPRFVRDRSFDESIERAIAYLDGMVGQRRGDLAAETMVDLLGDPKFARCILACLADTFHYRTPSIAEAIGSDAARVLEGEGVTSAADLRALIYDAVNSTRAGFVTSSERSRFLSEQGHALGLSADDLDRVLHLDAERNAVLVRSGDLPDPQHIVARYNATLMLSVLRHARTVSLELPGLSADTIGAVCERNDTPY